MSKEQKTYEASTVSVKVKPELDTSGIIQAMPVTHDTSLLTVNIPLDEYRTLVRGQIRAEYEAKEHGATQLELANLQVEYNKLEACYKELLKNFNRLNDKEAGKRKSKVVKN